MKRGHITATIVTLITVGIVFAAQLCVAGDGDVRSIVLENKVNAAGTDSASGLKLPIAVEKDPRIQAVGKSWRFDQAIVTAPTHPRVLLIGDSILNGYLPLVTKALAGKAYVDAWANPYCQSALYNELLAEVLAQGPYEVVHINTGLHGWQKGRIPEGQFELLTKAFIEVIRQKCPKAQIIWASSTPVTVKGKPAELDPVINPVIIEQNRMAAKVMNDMHVPVNDFYSLLAANLELAHGDQFHWNSPAYKILADACVNSIVQALPAKVAPRQSKDAPPDNQQ